MAEPSSESSRYRIGVEAPFTAHGVRSMSSKVMKFLTDWLRWHAVGRVASAEDIPNLVSRCLSDAAREGISRIDIEGAIGPLEDCIRQSLLKIRK